jgi:hypothetical protein
MNEVLTNVPEQDDHLQAECRQYFNLIEGGICFVRADGTDRFCRRKSGCSLRV